MVTVVLAGGFGNQLFQYAAGVRLSKKLATDLYVDISRLNTSDSITKSYRSYKLNAFLKQPKIKINSFFKWKLINLQLNLPKVFNILFPFIVIKEQEFGEIVPDLNTKKDVILLGNWQNYLNFSGIANELEDILKLNTIHNEKYLEILNLIEESKSVAIHVRRGDYVTNKVADEVLGALPLEYYYKGISFIAQKNEQLKYFIFSDDIKWVKNNLTIPGEVYYVEIDDMNNDIFEFELMRNCKHFIIANSTYSWWAAWLRAHKSGVVLVPKCWFKNGTKMDTLLPEFFTSL